jgi:hypothetical protein
MVAAWIQQLGDFELDGLAGEAMLVIKGLTPNNKSAGIKLKRAGQNGGEKRLVRWVRISKAADVREQTSEYCRTGKRALGLGEGRASAQSREHPRTGERTLGTGNR